MHSTQSFNTQSWAGILSPGAPGEKKHQHRVGKMERQLRWDWSFANYSTGSLKRREQGNEIIRRPRRPNEVVSRDTLIIIIPVESDPADGSGRNRCESPEGGFLPGGLAATAILMLPAEERALHCLQAGYKLRCAKSLPQARPAGQPHSMHCFPGPLKQKGRSDEQGTKK